MYRSESEQNLWARNMSADNLRYYQRILESTPDLEQFSMNGESFNEHAVDEEQILELVDALRLYQGGRDSTIKELRLESFTFSLLGWNKLSDALRQLFQLKKLFMRGIRVITTNGDEDGNDDDEGVRLVEGLSGLTQTCPHFEELHLVNCNLNSMACQALSQLKFSLRMPPPPPPLLVGLRVLSLEGNSIGNAGVKCIANALRGNTSLVSLDLDRVGCSRSGITVLAEVLKENDCLKSLSLVGNGSVEVPPPIPIDGDTNASSGSNKDNDITRQRTRDHCPICDLLATNTCLRQVRLSAGPASQHVDFLIRLNRWGRKYLGNADVMTRIFHLMLGSVSNDVDVIFYFLKSQSGIL